MTINTPNIPVLHNADVKSYTDAAQIKDALVLQLYSPVRWVETVQAVQAMGAQKTAECGPGKVLAGLTKRIIEGLPCVALVSNDTFLEFNKL